MLDSLLRGPTAGSLLFMHYIWLDIMVAPTSKFLARILQENPDLTRSIKNPKFSSIYLKAHILFCESDLFCEVPKIVLLENPLKNSLLLNWNYFLS